MEKQFKHLIAATLAVSVLAGSAGGAVMGFWAGNLASTKDFSLAALLDGRWFGPEAGDEAPAANRQVVSLEEESAVTGLVAKVQPAVVSIIVTKDLPVIERYYSSPRNDSFFRQFFGDGFDEFFGAPQYRQNGTEKQEVGGGTGFLLDANGYILTNKHVVTDEAAEYTVLMNDEKKYPAQVLARDPANDLAIIKIEGQDFPYIELADSETVKVGQTVVAIGNALGEFRNTVSKGVVSGLARSITAGGAGFGTEELTGVIQTDASINPGNSGGPLLNIGGQAIGINTAIVQGAQAIGFAIPINDAKNIYESVKQFGRFVRPWLGVRYVMVNDALAEENKLSMNYGALVVRGETMADLAVIPGSPADQAGLRENDIILELGGKKIGPENPLAKEIAKHRPGDTVVLKVLSQGKEKDVSVKLEEMR